MKKTKLSIARITATFWIFLLCLSASVQTNQQEKQKGTFEQFINSTVKVEDQNANIQTDEKETKQNNRANDSNKTEMPQKVPEYSTPDLPPTVDYLKEAERIQREINAKNQRQSANVQRQLEETQQQYESAPKQPDELQNQVLQQDQQLPMTEQDYQNFLEAKRQKEAAKQIEAAQWKLIWLIPLFEILQTIGLALIAYKYNVARKSVLAMTVGLGICILLFLALVTQLKIDIFPIGLIVGILSGYAYVVGKLSTYVIVSLLPEKLTAKLITAFGTGISLIILYSFLDRMTGYGSIGVLFGIGVMLIGGIIALVKGTNTEKEDLHGSARFAERKDFSEFEKDIEPGSFILAPIDPQGNHGEVSLPRSLSGMHGLILGGTGTGKSRGYFMPNCAKVRNTSIVVTDPKSELWKYTSGFHKKALRFAPSEPDSSQCFNWIPLCTDARMAELCARAIMTAGSTQNTDQFWIDSETAFLSAIFAHTAVTKYPTPLTAYRLFTRKKPDELLQILLNSPSYVAREQAIIFEQTDARIKGAIVPAVASRMQFMRDPNIQLTTSAQLEAPHFGQLRHTPTAVYWCLREQDIARLRPLTSIFFTVLLEQIASEAIPENSTGIPINLMLDEFANIGKIPDFETTISLARGRDVALWLGIQSLSQLNQTYGNHAAQTIISNCATKIALHGLDYQTAEYISKSLGEKTVSHSSSSFNFGLTGGSVGSHSAKHRRPLLTPDEVMRLKENEAIIRTSNKYPMKLFKGYYDEKPNAFPITFSLTEIYGENENSEDEETLI
jgi:type IV secretion system protein VirD4